MLTAIAGKDATYVERDATLVARDVAIAERCLRVVRGRVCRPGRGHCGSSGRDCMHNVGPFEAN